MEKITTSNTNKVKGILFKYGVCILEDYISKQEAKQYFREVITELEEIVNFQYDDESTWEQIEEISDQGKLKIPHMRSLWKIRSEDKICNLYSELCSSDDIISSFDGMLFDLTSSPTGEKYHINQSLLDPDLKMYRGLLSLNKISGNDSSVCVLLKSHKFFTEYANNQIENSKMSKTRKKEKTIIDKDFFINKGCEELKITCKAGSIILIDSKAAHYTKIVKRKKRVLCCVNLSYVSTKELISYNFSRKNFSKRSLEMFREGKCTNSWPQFRKEVKTYFSYVPSFSPSEKILKLITGNISN